MRHCRNADRGNAALAPVRLCRTPLAARSHAHHHSCFLLKLQLQRIVPTHLSNGCRSCPARAAKKSCPPSQTKTKHWRADTSSTKTASTTTVESLTQNCRTSNVRYVSCLPPLLKSWRQPLMCRCKKTMPTLTLIKLELSRRACPKAHRKSLPFLRMARNRSVR